MMPFDFDKVINRKNTHSYKWDQLTRLFGHEDVLPLWVADMDFESPPAVKQALVERAKHGIYGYCVRSNEYVQAIVDWYARRHAWQLKSEWISDSPSIVTTLSLCVEQLSEPGDAVIVQSPVYYPFYDVIQMNGRKAAINPLIKRDHRFEMDYEQLETLMKNGAKLLLLCNPHNPGGRVWERDELMRLAELCLQYEVKVVSDEIHCDLLLPGNTYTPFASLSDEIAEITVTCLAPTKTFNLPGLHTSYLVDSNPALKRKLDYRIKALSLHMASYFAQDAVIAAYNEGDQWLDELMIYIQANLELALTHLAEHLPVVSPMKPDATYLLWVDVTGLGLSTLELKKLMFDEARVAFSEGSIFGTEGRSHIRINLACPRSILLEALERFTKAASKL